MTKILFTGVCVSSFQIAVGLKSTGVREGIRVAQDAVGVDRHSEGIMSLQLGGSGIR